MVECYAPIMNNLTMLMLKIENSYIQISNEATRKFWWSMYQISNIYHKYVSNIKYQMKQQENFDVSVSNIQYLP